MKYLGIIISLMLAACHRVPQIIDNHAIDDLPEAVTNNAVSLVKNSNGTISLFSFNGLAQGKSWKDVHNKAFAYTENKWQQLVVPEGMHNVLASTAVSIGHEVYIIGGYTVAENNDEKSVPEIYKYNTVDKQWALITSMPVPVDDTVALVYANRYIYLVSGWHDVDNVSLVQVYDTHEDRWFNASHYPAPAVFGHSGGIVGDTMIICDGVKVVVTEKGKKYAASPVCMRGEIDPIQPQLIEWHEITHHSGTALYRMASVGNDKTGQIIFAGGSDNPYNYNGIGYNDVPSEASGLIHVYQINTGDWKLYSKIIPPSMDHRALLHDGNWFYIIGGMQSNQVVSKKVSKFKLPQ